MIVSLFMTLSALEPVLDVTERCAQAHESQNRAKVSIKVDTRGLYSSEHTTYNLAYDRAGSADLTVNRAKPFRVIVTANQVTEYDAATRQYSEKLKGDETIDAAVKHSVGSLDELVASLMTEKGVRLWLKSLRLSNLWKMSIENGAFVVSNKANEDHTTFQINCKTHLLEQAEVKSDKYGTTWSFHYDTPSDIAFTPPKDAYKVKELTPEMVPPAYSSALAKKTCERIFARYDNPRNLAYLVESDEESFKVWIDRGRASQRDRHAQWTVDSKNFTIALNDSRSYASGPTEMNKVTDSVNAAGTRVEPLLKLSLRGINPFRLYMGKNARVTYTGRTNVNGEACSIIESVSPDSKLSLIARDRDGFVLSLASIPKGAQTSSIRRFRPIKVEKDSFTVDKPQGWTVRTVDEIAKQAQKPDF